MMDLTDKIFAQLMEESPRSNEAICFCGYTDIERILAEAFPGTDRLEFHSDPGNQALGLAIKRGGKTIHIAFMPCHGIKTNEFYMSYNMFSLDWDKLGKKEKAI